MIVRLLGGPSFSDHLGLEKFGPPCNNKNNVISALYLVTVALNADGDIVLK